MDTEHEPRDELPPPPQRRQDTRPPKALPTVAGYEVLGVLGRGGMGVVYKARQKSLGRLVALKMILRDSHQDAEALARFSAEAQTLARVQHPNVVHIYDVLEVDG